MAEPSALPPPLAKFFEIASRYSYPGVVEYLLWEVVEGLRETPTPFHDPLPHDDIEALLAVRDLYGVWPFFNTGGWALSPIRDWRTHAATCNAHQAARRFLP